MLKRLRAGKKHRVRRFLELVVFAFFCFFGIVGLLAYLVFLFYRHNKAQNRTKKSRFAAWTTPGCQPIAGHLYARPDPLIYSQQYLMSLGLAVTWQNPDIHLEKGGVPVDSSDLTPNTDYDVIARIWNGSTAAPVVNLPVNVSYLSFGIATEKHPVASTKIDLGVKGSPAAPAFAKVKWTTPTQPGHYCLLVEFVWSDDSNPNNNVGQHNTQVRPLNSPRAEFTFALRNPARERRTVKLVADSYSIGDPVPCPDPARTGDGGQGGGTATIAAQRARILKHSLSLFPIPAGWTVNIQPSSVLLAPNEERQVTVEIIAPDGFAGRRSFNVNGFDEGTLLGGVTLIVTG